LDCSYKGRASSDQKDGLQQTNWYCGKKKMFPSVTGGLERPEHEFWILILHGHARKWTSSRVTCAHCDQTRGCIFRRMTCGFFFRRCGACSLASDCRSQHKMMTPKAANSMPRTCGRKIRKSFTGMCCRLQVRIGAGHADACPEHGSFFELHTECSLYVSFACPLVFEASARREW